MAVALEASTGAAYQDVRNVVVQVLVGVAHVGAVEDQRVIQQRAVAVRRLLHLVGQVRQAGDVIASDLGVVGDALGVFGVVRSSVETAGGAAQRVRASGQVAGVEHRSDAGDVGLVSQQQQIRMQLDVLVER